MKTFYVWLFLLFCYGVLYVFVPVVFSMKSDLAVLLSIVILSAVPFCTYHYLKFFNIIKGDAK